MSKLRLVANLWTLVGHPRPGREWTTERKLRAIAEAGFDDVTGDLDAEIVGRAHALGLGCVGWFWATDRASIAAGVERHRGLGVRHVTVFLGRHDTPAAEVLALARELARAGGRAGLHLAPETHRDTATETPEKLAALLAGFRKATGEELPLTWDFSHHALVKHLAPGDWAVRLLTEPENFAQAELLHLRPFNGHHAQVPVRVRGRRTPEYREFLAFATEVLRRWRTAPANADGVLRVCPEVGPVAAGYGLSHEDAPWAQAVTLAGDLRAAWRAAGR